jgi:hypothetical protein
MTSPNRSSLDEMLENEKRAHAIQIAVLNDQEFVEGALKGLADELSGNPGKPWRELKAELKVGHLRG